MSNLIKNRTTLYILPFITNLYHESMTAYIGIYEFNDLNSTIYIVCDSKKISNNLQKQPNFQGKTYVNNKEILIFALDFKYQDTYLSFIIGNYQDIKDKRIMLEYWIKNNKVYYNKLFTMFYNKSKIRKTYIENLTNNNFSDKELEEMINEVIEVDSIFQLKDELIF